MEPKWHDWHLPHRCHKSAVVQQWLLERGSLTRRVRRACDGVAHIRVHKHMLGVPFLTERLQLGLPRGAKVLVREVELCCDGQPWVFARTLIPLSTMHSSGMKLRYLGTRSLGTLLFTDVATHRHKVEIACLLSQHQLFRQMQHITTTTCARPQALPAMLWGRRSLFRLPSGPLLVNEIFLPDIVIG